MGSVILVHARYSYSTDLTDAAWALVAPLLPPAGHWQTTAQDESSCGTRRDLLPVADWRLIHRDLPAWGTVYHYVRTWKWMSAHEMVRAHPARNAGVWGRVQAAIYEKTRAQAGRSECPSVVIMDGQSVKTTERGGVRGFDGYKRVKGRKRHILVDTLGLPIANRVEPANISDRYAGERLLAGLSPLFPGIQTVMADAGHESRKLARQLMRDNGWKLQIVKRKQRAFEVIGLTWIVERTFAWLGRNRRLSKDYEYAVQSSETMLDIAGIRLMLNRLTAP
jgi:putative transposase